MKGDRKMYKTFTYTDLFEDEVAEIVRDLPHDSTIIMDAYREFYPANMMCEDGVYTSGSGMYAEYLNGKRTGSIYGLKYLVDHLAHTTFKVIVK